MKKILLHYRYFIFCILATIISNTATAATVSLSQSGQATLIPDTSQHYQLKLNQRELKVLHYHPRLSIKKINTGNSAQMKRLNPSISVIRCHLPQNKQLLIGARIKEITGIANYTLYKLNQVTSLVKGKTLPTKTTKFKRCTIFISATI